MKENIKQSIAYVLNLYLEEEADNYEVIFEVDDPWEDVRNLTRDDKRFKDKANHVFFHLYRLSELGIDFEEYKIDEN